MPSSRNASIASALIFSLITACSTREQQDGDATASADETTASEWGRHSDLVIPPPEYYDALLEEELSNPHSLSLADELQIVWLNFNGANLTKGYKNGQSFILCKSSATLPASGFSAATRTSIIEAAHDHFRKAYARIRFVLDKPTAGIYTTMHVGGSYADLGCSRSGVLGIAPFDQGNRNRNDVAFTFLSSDKSVKTISDTIAHETAHSLGLEHTTNSKDLMYFQAQKGAQIFTVGALENGKTQDGPALLKSVLGFECPVTPQMPEPVSLI